jgi:hypothetical protein
MSTTPNQSTSTAASAVSRGQPTNDKSAGGHVDVAELDKRDPEHAKIDQYATAHGMSLKQKDQLYGQWSKITCGWPLGILPSVRAVAVITHAFAPFSLVSVCSICLRRVQQGCRGASR